MSKPTKYQREWMGELAVNNGTLDWWVEDVGGTQESGWYFGFKDFSSPPISGRSVYRAINNGWLHCSDEGTCLNLTPAGKRALEE